MRKPRRTGDRLLPRAPAARAGASLALVGALLSGTVAYAGEAIRVTAEPSIVVDGDVTDWKGVPVAYLDNGPRVTAFAHDEHFLYIQFHFSDPALAQAVLRTGAIVWVSPDGSHDASFGLRYRGSPAIEAAIREAEPTRDDASGDEPTPFGPGRRGPAPDRTPVGSLEVLHSGVVDDVIDAGARPDGPAAAGGVADGVYAYELRIPLADALPGPQAGTAHTPSRIAVGFQMNGVTAAEREAMQERMRSSRGGPPGGFGGGRRGGWGDAPGGGPRSGEREGRRRGSEVLWVDVEVSGGQEDVPPVKQ